MKFYSVNKARIPVNTTSTHTTSNFTTITCDTTASTAVQYGNFSEASFVQRLGNEDVDQFWFVVKVVWEAQGVADYNMKKATLVNALQDHALTCYIKYANDNLNGGVADIQMTLNREFSRPKSEA